MKVHEVHFDGRKGKYEKMLDCVTICAILHNFLLLENDECTEVFYEDDDYTPDLF